MPRRLFVLLVALFASSLGLGAERGYWSCAAGAWVAVGHPLYDKPVRDCSAPVGPLPKSESSCLAAGGTWKPIGIFPAPVCRMAAADAGRICGDADECESGCLATLNPGQIDRVQHGESIRTRGRCAPARPLVGCLAIVRQGDAIVCLD